MIFSIQINQKALSDSGIKEIEPVDALVLSAIHHLVGSGYAKPFAVDSKSYYWLSSEMIAAQLPIFNLHKRQVDRSLRRLEELNLIIHDSSVSEKNRKSLWVLTPLFGLIWNGTLPKTASNPTKNGKVALPNLVSYNNNIDNIEEDNNTPFNSPKGEGEILSDFQNRSVKGTTPKSELNSITPQVPAAPLKPSDGWREKAFEAIWNESTKRGSKKDAEKAFKSKIKSKDEATYLLASVRLIAEAVKANRKELGFTPHISKLINSGNYSDESYMNEFKAEAKKELNNGNYNPNVNYV